MQNTVYKPSDINFGAVEFGKYWKNGNIIHVPILMNSSVFYIQVANMLSFDFENSNNNKLIGAIRCNSDVYAFLDNMNRYIESNLKKVLQKIKTVYILDKKFNYDTCYKYDSKLCLVEFNFTDNDISNGKTKFYSADKKCMNAADIKKHMTKADDKFLFSSIVQPVLNINMKTGDILFDLITHQVKLNDDDNNCNKINVLENYSFIDSDNDADYNNIINIDTCTENIYEKSSKAVDIHKNSDSDNDSISYHKQNNDKMHIMNNNIISQLSDLDLFVSMCANNENIIYGNLAHLPVVANTQHIEVCTSSTSEEND